MYNYLYWGTKFEVYSITVNIMPYFSIFSYVLKRTWYLNVVNNVIHHWILMITWILDFMPALLNVCYKKCTLKYGHVLRIQFDYSHVLSCTSNIKRRLLPLSGIQGWREIGQINRTSTEKNRAVLVYIMYVQVYEKKTRHRQNIHNMSLTNKLLRFSKYYKVENCWETCQYIFQHYKILPSQWWKFDWSLYIHIALVFGLREFEAFERN